MLTVPVPPPPPPQFPPPRGSVIEGQSTGVLEDARVTMQVCRLTGERYVQQPHWQKENWVCAILDEHELWNNLLARTHPQGVACRWL
jgi:hypothetical protein